VLLGLLVTGFAGVKLTDGASSAVDGVGHLLGVRDTGLVLAGLPGSVTAISRRSGPTKSRPSS
jgi:hypothetical protein